MRALVVGASAGVGLALCEGLAAQGSEIVMIASDSRDLEAAARHLSLVYEVEVQTIAVNAADITECVSSVKQAVNSFGAIDSLFFPIGVSLADDNGFLDSEQSCALMNINLITVMGLVSCFLPDLLKQPQANIVGFGSVAAIRGRKSNIVYSAAKRGLESYFESLRHLTVDTSVSVQFYRLGYVATQQSFGKRLLFPVAPPQKVAEKVVKNLGKDSGQVYFPRFWGLIALAVAWLPWRIYKKLDF